jgi:enoyl-CoA hydratase/carnithine racemase
MSTKPYVQVTVEERIAILTITNPRANVLSQGVLDKLEAVLLRFLDDAEIKVIILTGDGMLFSAGADVKELAALGAHTAAEAFARRGQALCNLIESAQKPIIAAINGAFALGGGNELAMACHLRLAEEGTQLGNPEVHLGLTVGWGASQRLAHLVGPGKALELLLTGKRISAREAERIGLVNRVVADGTVLQEALSLAHELNHLSAPVLAATLKAVYVGQHEGFDRGLDEEARQFGRLCENEDWQEGIRAFFEKRKARFQDR